MAGGPWEKYATPSGGTSQPPAVIYGAPDPYKATAEARANRDQQLQEINAGITQQNAQLAAERAARERLEWNATHNHDGTKKVEGGNPIPAWAATPYEKQIGILGGIARGLNSFQDDYAGNSITGGLENTIQAVTGMGTPGQRDWWAQFGSTDNVIRNDLFGAALTESEKAAYAATTVTPRMDPAEVRRNLQSRRDILSGAMKRRTAFLKAQGYSEEAIEALAGEYAEELGAAIVAPGNSTMDQIMRNDPLRDYDPNRRDTPPTDMVRSSNTVMADGAPKTPAWSMTPLQEGRLLKYSLTASSPEDIQAFAHDELGADIGIEEARNAFNYYKSGGREAAQISYDRANEQIAGMTAAQRDTTAGEVDAIARGAADTVTLGFSDELAGLSDTFSGGTLSDNIARQRAIDALDEKVNPYARLGGQIAGGFALPTFGATGAKGLATVGALYGAGYGLGSGEGGIANRLVSAGTGGVVGGVTGGVLGQIGSRIASRGGRPDPSGGRRAEALDLIAAANRQGVDVLPADVGGNLTQRLTAGTAQTTFGGPRIINAARAQQEQAQAAVGRAASEVAAPTTEFGAGRAAQTGLTKWVKSSDTQANRLYGQISVPAAAPAEIRNTLNALEEVTQGMASNEALSPIWTGHPRLQKTLEALQRPEVRQITRQDGGLPGWEKKIGDKWVRLTQREIDAGAAEGGGASWEDMKRLRSIVGEIIGQPSLSSEGPEIAAMRRLYAGLSEDMRLTAEKAGPSALREFERANAFYNARASRIKNVVEPIIGDGSGEGQAAFNRIQNWAKNKGESMRVAQLARSLPPEERETLGATIISNLGKSSAGRQNGEGSAFSLNEFLTHWNQLDPAAKQALFTRNQRSALNDMAKVADRTKQAQAFANTSNTAGASNVNATTGGLAAAIPLAFTAGPLAALAAVSPAAGQYVTGRMLASPRMVQWLTRTPKDPSVAIRRLEQIAIREPAIAPDIARLTQALQQSPGRLAASEQEQQ